MFINNMLEKRHKGYFKARQRICLSCLFFMFLSFVGLLPISCTSIDCPLNNRVYANYKLAGDVTILTDTLNISTTKVTGIDSVLINNDVGIDSFILPMSYRGMEDIFYIHIKGKNGTATLDTLKVRKLDHTHFESVDCKPSFFHTITGVEYTHYRIDSVVIKSANVTYDVSKPHFYIYFKNTGN